MNIAPTIISCLKYSDAWSPFLAFARKFWKIPTTFTLVTDGLPYGHIGTAMGVQTFIHEGSWVDILKAWAKKCDQSNTAALLFQEDFWINAPVDTWAIERAAHLMLHHNAGCVRLYPCPGATDDMGDPHFGYIRKGTDYRVSCQAALWNPRYLVKILEHCRTTPADFEIEGTEYSNQLEEPVLAWKREVEPWPLQYLCSAISRGKWERGAKELCDRESIYVDWEKRGFVE